ncbi:MAG: hypothetical protein HGB23_08065 [Chlorobiaceae bacterium]|nr:hypothetical protein [Chlorobiaceae bacterium]
MRNLGAAINLFRDSIASLGGARKEIKDYKDFRDEKLISPGRAITQDRPYMIFSVIPNIPCHPELKGGISLSRQPDPSHAFGMTRGGGSQ